MTRALAAELYALLHRGNPGDVAFYRRFCAGASSALELGTGAGRVALALAGDGLEVVGLDVDPQMLALAEAARAQAPPAVRARLSFVAGNMARCALGRRFDRVIVPYNGIACLVDPDDLRACLALAREHLSPGGRLALDVYRSDPLDEVAEGDEGAPEPTKDDDGDHGQGGDDGEHGQGGDDGGHGDDGDEDEPIVAIEHGGRVFRVYEYARLRPGQRLDVRYRFVADDAVSEHTIAQRVYQPDELAALAEAAGLAIVERAGGFRGEPLDDAADHVVLVAAPR